jgi:hypothetical protein
MTALLSPELQHLLHEEGVCHALGGLGTHASTN